MRMQEYIILKEEEGQTLEKYIKKKLKSVPLSYIYKLFRKKDIKVNGIRKDMKSIVHENDQILVYIPDNKLDSFVNQEKDIFPSIEIEPYIIYEDENILLVNKPRGMLVQKNEKNVKSLDDLVLSYLLAKGEYDPSNRAFTPGPSHRLDRNTAGIVIFGKNTLSLHCLMKNMQDKSKIQKKYLALVKGVIKKPGEINASLKKDSMNSLVKVTPIEAGGKEAITLYKPIKVYGDFTLLDVTLLTGRTHQIRVHMSYINHPIVGDNKYGDFVLNKEMESKYHFTNQFLVAYHLKFGELDFPLSYLKGKEFEIKIPNDMFQILNNIC